MSAGMIISVLFSALPLNNIRFVSPLEILRGTFGQPKKYSRIRLVILGFIIIFPWLFTWLQIRDIFKTSAFYLGLAVTFVLLFLIAKGLIWLVKKGMQPRFPFIWRQGFSNLFRPNNQTSVLVIVIGLGAFLIANMALIQNSLLGQVEFAGAGERTNTVLFDIQPYQKEEVVALVNQYDLPVQQLVPIVTMRIDSLREKSVEFWRADTTADISDWRLTREYRVTYRDSLINTEKLLKGEFLHKRVGEGDSVFISVSQDMAESLNLELKDEIIWDVQGVPVITYVGSTREIDWQRIQTNFMVVFPEGVLEDAPQFYVILSRIDDKQRAAAFQQEMVKKFPTVSLIDLNLILDTLDKVFEKIAFVIRFMALFTIITGMLILSAAVINSKYARLKENVLLRTMGALRKQISGITLVEYSFLGFFAGLSGILLAYFGAWLLAVYLFEIKYFPDLLSLLFIWLLVTALTIFIGWLNSRSILNRSPLEVLRKEA
jgi:putative ABC transport system permease protein